MSSTLMSLVVPATPSGGVSEVTSSGRTVLVSPSDNLNLT